mmetsp:Transcript_43966/g.79529  ORF Transcript_43966/g.79529 Transcript_43966/m.79529 type:complete len:201 (-) Transcript_43966:644-1246(-)
MHPQGRAGAGTLDQLAVVSSTSAAAEGGTRRTCSLAAVLKPGVVGWILVARCVEVHQGRGGCNTTRRLPGALGAHGPKDPVELTNQRVPLGCIGASRSSLTTPSTCRRGDNQLEALHQRAQGLHAGSRHEPEGGGGAGGAGGTDGAGGGRDTSSAWWCWWWACQHRLFAIRAIASDCRPAQGQGQNVRIQWRRDKKLPQQ